MPPKTDETPTDTPVEQATPVDAAEPAAEAPAEAPAEATPTATPVLEAPVQPLGDLGYTPVSTPLEPTPGVSFPAASTIIDTGRAADDQPGPDPEQAEAIAKAAEWQAEQDRIASDRLTGAATAEPAE